MPGIHPVLRSAALTAAFVLVAVLAARQPAAPELGRDLRAGEGLLSGQGLPRAESITFSGSGREPAGDRWGYQVLAALAHGAAGPAGLAILNAAVVLSAFLVVALTASIRRADPLVLALLLLPAALAAEPFFEAGAEPLSWLLLALTLLLLHRYAGIRGAEGGGGTPRGAGALLRALVVIQLGWVNAGGLFVLGWLAMGCFVAGLWVRDRRPDLRLAAWSAGAAAAFMINPHGWRAIPLALASVPAGGPALRSTLLCFYLLAILSLAAAVAAARRREPWIVLLWLAFAILAARSGRLIPPMVVACLPWTAWQADAGALLDSAVRRSGKALDARRSRAVLTAAASVCILAALVLTLRVSTDAHYIDGRRLTRTGLGWNRFTLPVDAAGFASRVGLDGVRVLNDPRFGSWLGWSLGAPVHADASLEGDGDDLRSRYAEAMGSQKGREAEVARYGIRWMIFPYAADPKLLFDVSEDPAWALAYVDHLSVVFVRAEAASRAWVDPNLIHVFAARESAPRPGDLPGLGSAGPRGAIASWLGGIFRRQSYPAYDRNVGHFHFARGEIDHAAARYARAIDHSRGAYYEIYRDLGSALFYMGEYRLARRALGVVLSRDPADPMAVKRLAEMASRPDV